MQKVEKKKPVAKKPAASTAKKTTTAAKKPAAKKPAASTAKKVISRFPKKELNTWLRKNSSWDHSAWEALIKELGESGFSKWTSTQEGQDEIGLYLETNRK